MVGMGSDMALKALRHNFVHLPRGFAVLESQCQHIIAFRHFACQNQVGTVLLDLGASDLDLVGRFEARSHVV
jgi:hypothetical protein